MSLNGWKGLLSQPHWGSNVTSARPWLRAGPTLKEVANTELSIRLAALWSGRSGCTIMLGRVLSGRPLVPHE